MHAFFVYLAEKSKDKELSIMNNNKINKIDIRVNDYTYNKFNELVQYHNINKTKLIEKAILEMYDKDILGNSICPDVKKEYMTHMCNIVKFVNCVEDDEIRKDILEEVTKACQTLR